MGNIGPVMLDIADTQLNEEDKELIASKLCGGLILFTRNFESADQILALTQSIRAINPDVIIAVDQEGGRVQRFKEEFSILPPLQTLGDYYLTRPDRAIKYAHDFGELMAREVQAVGCDISFAPVLDLGYSTSRVIGDRAFSTDPDIISVLAAAYVAGMRAGGMAATGKHFPGHGSVEADSHVDIPYDERNFSEIRDKDLVPFIKLNEQLGALMPAHIIYSNVDSLPAGFSEIWLQQILRQKMKFDGVIFSDDLSMKGAEVMGDFAQRAKGALEAGCDMVLVCNDRAATRLVIEALDSTAINQESHRRLQKLQMPQPPIGLKALKASARWQELNETLMTFQQEQGK